MHRDRRDTSRDALPFYWQAWAIAAVGGALFAAHLCLLLLTTEPTTWKFGGGDSHGPVRIQLALTLLLSVGGGLWSSLKIAACYAWRPFRLLLATAAIFTALFFLRVYPAVVWLESRPPSPLRPL